MSPAASKMIRALFQRAVSLIRATHILDALICLDELLLIDSHHVDALACRAWIHTLHCRSDAARADLEAALRYAPPGWPRRAEVESQLAPM